MIKNNLNIVFCAHIGTPKENIGDTLSAQALKKLTNAKKIYCLPRDDGLSFNKEVVYGGGGMIRPLFSERINNDYKLREKNINYYIYGVGLNIDKLTPPFSKTDLFNLKIWLNSAESVTVRDLETKIFIEKLCNKKFKLAPCPTYQIIRSKNAREHSKKYDLGIVVSFGHTETYKKYKKYLLTLISDLIKNENLFINIICHDEQDYIFAKKEYLNNNKIHICRLKSFNSVIKEYSSCNAILTVRGHGVIFAAAMNIPCSIIPLNTKLTSLYEFHYAQKNIRISFDYRQHLKTLKKRKLPKKINYKFKI
jgi:predicted RNA-binding Zn-ribbon protein involved in translation (DUF1610 family)